VDEGPHSCATITNPCEKVLELNSRYLDSQMQPRSTIKVPYTSYHKVKCKMFAFLSQCRASLLHYSLVLPVYQTTPTTPKSELHFMNGASMLKLPLALIVILQTEVVLFCF
jgi:hypothetical protein